MKILSQLLCLLIGLSACTSNPLLTGNPADWVHKPASELRVGLGEPNRIINHQDGSETWEYFQTGQYVREHRSPGKFVNLTRYLIRDGKVKKWFSERMEDGVVVWRDH